MSRLRIDRDRSWTARGNGQFVESDLHTYPNRPTNIAQSLINQPAAMPKANIWTRNLMQMEESLNMIL